MTYAHILTLLTLALVTGLTGLFIRRPGWGMALFILVLPFERIGSYPLNPATGYPLLHPAQIVGAALMGAYGWRLLFRKERPQLVKPLLFLGAFLLTSLVSAITNNVQEVWQILAWLLFIAVLFLVVSQQSRAQTNVIKRAMAITLLAVSLFGIYQFVGDLTGLPIKYTGIRDRYSKAVLGFPRLQSTALEPLYFADYLFLPLFLLLALVVSNAGNDRLTQLALATGGVAFLLTLSRGAFVSGLIGLVTLFFFIKDRFKGWAKANLVPLIVGLVGLLLIAGAVITVSSSHTKGQKVGSAILKSYFTTNVLKTGTATERFRDQKLALQIWHQHPTLGVGIGGFGAAYYGCRVGKCVYRPNNQALEVLAEGGVIGFITFHLFLLSVLYYGWRALRQADAERRALIAGLMAATVAMIAQSQTFSGFLCCLTYTWGTLALLAGLSISPDVKAPATPD